MGDVLHKGFFEQLVISDVLADRYAEFLDEGEIGVEAFHLQLGVVGTHGFVRFLEGAAPREFVLFSLLVELRLGNVQVVELFYFTSCSAIEYVCVKEFADVFVGVFEVLL